jgi:hypothetical protein
MALRLCFYKRFIDVMQNIAVALSQIVPDVLLLDKITDNCLQITQTPIVNR